MDMNIVCLDLEGVLVPEIWIAFAEAAGIPELKRTTREEPDYDKLMKYRIKILKEHGLGLKEIQETIEKIDPMPGAKEFLDELKSLNGLIEEYQPRGEFDRELFEEIVRKIVLEDSSRLTFHLIGGVVFTEEIKEKGRCKTA